MPFHFFSSSNCINDSPATLCLSHGQSKEEGGPFPRLGFHPDLTTVAFNDLLTNRQTYTGSGIFPSAVQALEDSEYTVGVLRIDSNSIVSDREKPLAVLWFGRNMYALSLGSANLTALPMRFERVARASYDERGLVGERPSVTCAQHSATKACRLARALVGYLK